MDNIQVATKIKKLCKHKNITVKSLLEACNISKGFMYELEKKGRVPLADKLEVIADYLEVSVDYLLGRTTDPQSTYINKQELKDIAKKPQSKDLSKEEAEIIGLYRLLNVRDRTKLMSFIFELEDNIQKVK